MNERETPMRNTNRRVAFLRQTALTIAGGLALTVMLALTASASPCQQTDGQWGQLNGTSNDDAGCITEAEYVEAHSVDNLLSEGVIVSAIPNGDGTVTVEYALGGIGILQADPLERPVAANTNPASPAFEADAPTVREVLFPFEAGFSLLPA